MIRNKTRRHLEPPKLNLTAMVDVFTVLLVFLLKSYTAEGVLSAPVPVTLPSSTSVNRGEVNLLVTVTEKDLYLDKTRIDDPTFGSSENPDIPKLGESLTALLINRPLSPEQKKVTILGDKKVPYFLLKKVIATFSQKGFGDISLAVYEKGADR